MVMMMMKKTEKKKKTKNFFFLNYLSFSWFYAVLDINTLNIYVTMAWYVYVAQYFSGWFIAKVSTCQVRYY